MTSAPLWVIVILVAVNLACSVGVLALKDFRAHFGIGTLATGLILLVLLFMK